MPKKVVKVEIPSSSSSTPTSNSRDKPQSSSSSTAQSTRKNGTRSASTSARQATSNSKARSTSSARQQLTLFDAVAGRATYEGFLSVPQPLGNQNRDTSSSSLTPIPAEEVLFRLDGAPVRYEENDIYFADRHLNQQNELQRLPDSDLVKTLHTYVSDFYATLGDEVDFGSFDETALLALGILVEEAGGAVWSERETDGESEGSDMKTETKSELDEDALASEALSQGIKVETTSAETSQTLSMEARVQPSESADAKKSVVTGRAIPHSQDSGSPLRRVMKFESQPFAGEVEMDEGDGSSEV